MSPTDPTSGRLFDQAEQFARNVADLLEQTVAATAPVAARVRTSRVVVAPVNHEGDQTTVPLLIEGEHRLDLRVEYKCAWDFTAQYLAVKESNVALTVADLGEPLVRFEYVDDRAYAPAHVQVHGESSALG